jgi:hypothetical protein
VTKYGVTFTREFRVEVEADNLETAETLARRVVASFLAGTCKLLSILAGSNIAATGKAKRRRA